jgi:hypothetical protein
MRKERPVEEPRKPAVSGELLGHKTGAISIPILEDESDGEWEKGEMPTPTASQSPVRRGRQHTDLALPRLTSIPILSSRSESDYSLVLGYEASSASTQSAASNKRERDRSPAKTLSHLKLLKKPVEYISDEDRVRESIPDDVCELWADLRKLCKGNGYIPRRIHVRLLHPSPSFSSCTNAC